MSDHTYDFTDHRFYDSVWDLLVKEVGAQILDRGYFIYDFCQVENPSIEYRFGGIFGMGGKFWRNSDKFYISCYKKSETPEIIEKINLVNKKNSTSC